jgi:glutathione S-transferase
MQGELVFYTNPMSRGRIVRWMLEEVGQPYRTQILDYATGLKSPEYLAVNPMGKVPALTHGGAVITEASAICAYLADAFPEAGLAPPPGDPLRGPYLRWMFYAAGPVEAAVTNKSLKVEVAPQQERMVGYRNFATVLDVLESLVAGREYIVGDSFTAADVYLGSQIGFGLAFGTMEKRPAFETYWAGVSDRPAYKRASEIDNAAMPKPAG